MAWGSVTTTPPSSLMRAILVTCCCSLASQARRMGLLQDAYLRVVLFKEGHDKGTFNLVIKAPDVPGDYSYGSHLRSLYSLATGCVCVPRHKGGRPPLLRPTSHSPRPPAHQPTKFQVHHISSYKRNHCIYQSKLVTEIIRENRKEKGK